MQIWNTLKFGVIWASREWRGVSFDFNAQPPLVELHLTQGPVTAKEQAKPKHSPQLAEYKRSAASYFFLVHNPLLDQNHRSFSPRSRTEYEAHNQSWQCKWRLSWQRLEATPGAKAGLGREPVASASLSSAGGTCLRIKAQPWRLPSMVWGCRWLLDRETEDSHVIS